MFNEMTQTDSLQAGAAKEFLCSLFKSKIQVWHCIGALESSQTKSHRACERLLKAPKEKQLTVAKG